MANIEFLDKSGLELLVSKFNEKLEGNATNDAAIAAAVLKCVNHITHENNQLVFSNKQDDNEPNVIFTLDTTEFVKDGMVESVKVEDGNLVITFNTESGQEDITLSISEIFDAEKYYTKEETDAAFVKWGEYQGRKVISLENYDNIAGKDTNGQGHNLVMLSKWDVADFGAPGVHMNLNTKDTVTINDKEVVATLKDVEDKTENVVKYIPFEYKGEQRKSIVLDERDTISSLGANIAMVSTYSGLDFPVVELGGQKAALVLNSNDQPVKIELTENGERKQHVVATVDDFEPISEDYINSLFD